MDFASLHKSEGGQFVTAPPSPTIPARLQCLRSWQAGSGDWNTENILVFGYRGFGVSQKSHPKVAKKSEAMTLYIPNWVARMMHRDMAGASAITSSGKEIQILRVDAKQPSAVQSFGLRGEVMEAVYVNKCKLSSIFTSTAFSVWKNTDCMNKFIHIVLLSRYTWKILRNAASDSLTSILEASTSITKHRRQATGPIGLVSPTQEETKNHHRGKSLHLGNSQRIRSFKVDFWKKIQKKHQQNI